MTLFLNSTFSVCRVVSCVICCSMSVSIRWICSLVAMLVSGCERQAGIVGVSQGSLTGVLLRWAYARLSTGGRLRTGGRKFGPVQVD